jgi:hypothetical protein
MTKILTDKILASKKIAKLILFFIILMQITTSCQYFKSASTPYFMFTNFKVPDGSPNFQEGYRDGCSTVLYARGTVFYRNRYGFKFNPNKINDPEYNFGHQRGYSWCFQHGVQGNTGPKTPITRAIDPYGYDTTYNRGTIKDMGGLLKNNQHWKYKSYNLNTTFSPFQYGIDGSSTLTNNLFWSGGGGGGILTFK